MKNRWKHISAYVMLVFYMQALLLASFHVHPQLPQNESARTYTEYALPGTAHSVNACMDCPVCQFLAGLQMDVHHAAESLPVCTSARPFLSFTQITLAGQFSCVSWRAPPVEFCL